MAEVIAAGVVLILISTMTLKGFRLSGDMLLRGGRMMEYMAEAQERIALEHLEDFKRSRTLTFTAEEGETAQIQVTEKIYLIGSGKDSGGLNWRVVEAKGE